MCLFISDKDCQDIVNGIYGATKTIISKEKVVLFNESPSEAGTGINIGVVTPNVIWAGILLVTYTNQNGDPTDDTLSGLTTLLGKNFRFTKSIKQRVDIDGSINWRESVEMYLPFIAFDSFIGSCDSGAVWVSWQFTGRKIVVAP